MTDFVALLRSVNIGGRNSLPLTAVRDRLEELGFTRVRTMGTSGNISFTATGLPSSLQQEISTTLGQTLAADPSPLPVLVLQRAQLERVVAQRPPGFGENPERLLSDVIFLLGELEIEEAMRAVHPRSGVDEAWPGSGVIYFQRLRARRTQSHLNRTMSSPIFQDMTIRSWGTITRLLSTR